MTCSECIHHPYCIERGTHGICSEYEARRWRAQSYTYWWREAYWWECKEERNRKRHEEEGS